MFVYEYRGVSAIISFDMDVSPSVEAWSDWIFNTGNERLTLDALDTLLHEALRLKVGKTLMTGSFA